MLLSLLKFSSPFLFSSDQPSGSAQVSFPYCFFSYSLLNKRTSSRKMKSQQILLISEFPLITPLGLLKFHYFFLLLFLLFIAERFGSTAPYPLRPGYAQSMSLSVFLSGACVGKRPVILAHRCLSGAVVLQLDVVVFFYLDKYAELHCFGHEKFVNFPELQMLHLELSKINEFFMTRVDTS